MRILALTKYGRLGASSRLRFLQYMPWLKLADIQVTVEALLTDEQLLHRYQYGKYSLWQLISAHKHRLQVLIRRRQFDLLWIEKEALQWFPLWLELALLEGVPYVLDYDDAVFHHYDLSANKWIRKFFGRRIDGLMASARLVVAGNGYLAKRAKDAGAKWVEIIPTVIDLKRYPSSARRTAVNSGLDRVFRIVWIGSPSTVRYLQLLREPLQALIRHRPFVLRLIGGDGAQMPGVPVEQLRWTEETEVADIGACDVGVMPLFDSSWERGKCGYKLIQYMACHLPVVASGIGVNTEIVQHGENGYLASTPDQWLRSLEMLYDDCALRRRMGQSGRLEIEHRYCVQQTGPKLAKLLKAAGCDTEYQSQSS